jgi:hypothetical protein
MAEQKKAFIPTVDGIEVTSYDATADFTTDVFEFPDKSKDWSIDIQVSDTTNVPADSFTIGAAGSGLDNGSFNGLGMDGGAVVDITVAGGIVTVVSLVSGGTGYINGATYSLLSPLAGVGATQPEFTAVVTTNTDSTLDVLVCNTHNGTFKEYKPAATGVALATSSLIFDSIMPVRYMKLAYTANTSTGVVSINVVK